MFPKLLRRSVSAVPWKALRHSHFIYLPEQHVRDLRVEEAWCKTVDQVTIVYILFSF